MPGGFFEALNAALQTDALLMLLLGMVFGALTGVIPGLSGVTGMAIFLPFTIGMGPFAALMFFAGLGGAPRFTGAVTSIVLNIPGSPVNAATAFDGYPMARRGEAGRALTIAATASLLGTLFGLAVLLAAMPVVFSLLDVIGPAELFALAVLALTTISFSSTNTLQGFVRGLASGGLGLMVAFVGVATVTGRPRFNFGSDGYLFDGIQLVPLFIGVFAVAQVIRFAIDRDPAVASEASGADSGRRRGIRDTLENWRVLLRGSTIGAIIGAMPGVGGTAANFLSYSWTKATSKDPDRYGTGIPEGIVATEAADNSEHASSIVPTLSFGIPGSAEGALILGLLTLQGYITGPLLLVNDPQVLWVLVIGTIISVLIVSVVGLASTGLLAKVTLLPLRYLVPGVLVFALLGTYVAERNAWDVVMAVGIGLVGHWFIASGFSPASLVIGYVLGRLTEDSFVLAYQSGGGSYASLFTRPAALVIWAGVVLLGLMAIRQARRRRRLDSASESASSRTTTSAATGASSELPSWSAVGFTLLAMCFVGYVLVETGDLPTRVGLVPRAIALPTAALLLASLGLEAVRLYRAAWRPGRPPVTTWAIFVVVWATLYGVGIVFLGFTLASVLAAGIYVFAEGHGGASPKVLTIRTLATLVVTTVLLLGLDVVDFGGFPGLVFGEPLPPW